MSELDTSIESQDLELDNTAPEQIEVLGVSEEEEETYPSNDSPEERARKLGWRDESDYKGKPEDFIGADDFLKKHDEDLRAARRSNNHLERKVEKMEKGVDALLKHQERELERARIEAYKQAKQEIMERHAAAVEDGDLSGAQRALEDHENLAQQQARSAEAKREEFVVKEWIGKNSWINEDQSMKQDAIAYEQALADQGVALEDRLERVTKHMRALYPQKFPSPRQAPNMQLGRSSTPRTVAPRSYEALTKEYRLECDRAVKASNGRITKESFLQFCPNEAFTVV